MTRTRHPLVGAWGRAAAVLAVLLLLLDTGCARRFKLSDPDLAEAKESNALGDLRVYPSNRTISLYDEPAMRSVTIEREIRQRSRRERRGRILRRNTPGAIISEDLLNGQKLLWVTFDGSCNEPDCAFGFVQTEDKLYRLFQAPTLEGYGPPQNHHACLSKRRVMKLGKMKSLSEANDVMVNKKKNGKLRTVWLEVIKEVDDRVRTRSRRSGGVKPE